ncbi:hypothetical protein Scep_022716 [Stephania cephalantha]|uniref:Uncharacterized protein n=1 Tax=Stephania cephalantha TaxID=152367 RepID=A0AAP0FBX5_9MAGN
MSRRYSDGSITSFAALNRAVKMVRVADLEKHFETFFLFCLNGWKDGWMDGCDDPFPI